jgi:hypothetical protein
VLLIFDELLKGFEDAQERHLPQESQRASKNASPPSSPLTTPSPIARRMTRSSQTQVIKQRSASTDGSTSGINGTRALEQTASATDAVTDIDVPYLDFEHHFSTNINAG